jgi:hypothetical protein
MGSTQAYAAKWFARTDAAEQGVDSLRIGREGGLGLAVATGGSARAGPHRVLADDAAGQTPAANRKPNGRE